MEINIIPVAVKERQKFEGRGQKVNCSDGNLDPKRTGLKDNPSVSCIHADKSFVPPTFQGGSLVKETQSESATLETSAVQKLESAQAVPTFVFDIEQIFAKFLQLEVGDGAASADTVRSYISQTKQYLDWCKENLFEPLGADAEDIKLYRQYLVQSGYQNSTIATKLNIVRIFYKAALTHGLIKNNPRTGCGFREE